MSATTAYNSHSSPHSHQSCAAITAQAITADSSAQLGPALGNAGSWRSSWQLSGPASCPGSCQHHAAKNRAITQTGEEAGKPLLPQDTGQALAASSNSPPGPLLRLLPPHDHHLLLAALEPPNWPGLDSSQLIGRACALPGRGPTHCGSLRLWRAGGGVRTPGGLPARLAGCRLFHT